MFLLFLLHVWIAYAGRRRAAETIYFVVCRSSTFTSAEGTFYRRLGVVDTSVVVASCAVVEPNADSHAAKARIARLEWVAAWSGARRNAAASSREPARTAFARRNAAAWAPCVVRVVAAACAFQDETALVAVQAVTVVPRSSLRTRRGPRLVALAGENRDQTNPRRYSSSTPYPGCAQTQSRHRCHSTELHLNVDFAHAA